MPLGTGWPVGVGRGEVDQARTRAAVVVKNIFSPQVRGPGGSLKETYCTQLGMLQKSNPSYIKRSVLIVNMGLLGASWGLIGSLLGASWEPR